MQQPAAQLRTGTNTSFTYKAPKDEDKLLVRAVSDWICRLKARNLRTIELICPFDSYMIKPIVYHNFEEKEALEKELMAAIPEKKRASASKALMDIFSRPEKKGSAKKSRNIQ